MAVLALSCVISLRVAPAQAYEPTAIEEIQVTATRRLTEASNVSAALTFIASDEIHGAKLTTDALAAQIGVYLQQTTPGQGAAIIRGLKGSEILHIVVCGDVSRNRVMTLWGGYVKPATKAIELPANWDALLGAVRQPEIIETGSHA